MMIIEPPSTTSLRAATLLKLATLIALVFLCGGPASAQATNGMSNRWTLTWADEFNSANGSAPDASKWAFDSTGDNSNHELETYTQSATNVQQRDGCLVITALQQKTTRPDGTIRDYTSARIFTKALFTQTYGRFEASIKLPLGKGIWPAFWMLGDDIDAVSWPKAGEIDIFENIGEPTTSHSTIHGPGYSGAKGPSAKFTLPAGERVDTAFHLYALEWAPNDLKFFVDDHLVVERTPADLPAKTNWVFDKPFFMLLNLAVGGDWPGNPDARTTFPQEMLVDYVRVYKRADDSQPAPPRPSAPSR